MKSSGQLKWCFGHILKTVGRGLNQFVFVCMFIFVFLCLNWQVSQFEEFDLGEWPLHPPYHLIITERIIIMRKTMSMTINVNDNYYHEEDYHHEEDNVYDNRDDRRRGISERSPPQGGRCHPLLGSSSLPHYALKKTTRFKLKPFHLLKASCSLFKITTPSWEIDHSQQNLESQALKGAQDPGIVKW